MIQTIYNVIESIRFGVGACFLCVIIIPLYIVKYFDDKIHGITKPEYCVKGGIREPTSLELLSSEAS